MEALACPSQAGPAASSPLSDHPAQPSRCACATYVAGSNLLAHGALGTVYAGFHYDLNFLTIHGRSREWVSEELLRCDLDKAASSAASQPSFSADKLLMSQPAQPRALPHGRRLRRPLCLAGRRAAHPRPHSRRLPLGASERQAGGPCSCSLLLPFGSTGGPSGMLGMTVQPAVGCLLACPIDPDACMPRTSLCPRQESRWSG